MIGWSIFLAYLTGFIPAWRWGARRVIERERPHYRDLFRSDAKVTGFFIALIWPVSIPVWLFVVTVHRITFPNGEVRTRDEEAEDRQRKQEEELNRLRKLAREHNLPGWE